MDDPDPNLSVSCAHTRAFFGRMKADILIIANVTDLRGKWPKPAGSAGEKIGSVLSCHNFSF